MTLFSLAACLLVLGAMDDEGAPCPGCADLSSDPSVSGTSGSFGLFVELTTYSGSCFWINGVCIESYPCTPHVTVHAWLDWSAGGYFARSGTIGGTGIAGGRTATNGGGFLDVVEMYDDYNSVSCGGGTNYSINITVYANQFPGTAQNMGTMTTSGWFACDPCHSG